MEILAILWCESQAAQQRLRKTFRESCSLVKTPNVNLESEYKNTACVFSNSGLREGIKRSAKALGYETVKV